MKDFMTKNLKHLVILMWIINLFVTYVNIKHGMTNWQMFWNGFGFVACGFLTWYAAEISVKMKEKENLLATYGQACICNEFKKFKGLSTDTVVTTLQLNRMNYYICEGDYDGDIDTLYFVAPGITEDGKPCVDFLDPKDTEAIIKHAEMMNKRIGFTVEFNKED